MSTKWIRIAGLVIAVVAATAAKAAAFDFSIHVLITNDGVGQVLATLNREAPNARKQLDTTPNGPITAFTAKALKEIDDANKAQDTDDCLPNKTAAGASSGRYNFTIVASPCGGDNSIENSSHAFTHLFSEPPNEHFDAEKFQDASDFVAQSRARVLDFIRRGNYIGGRKALGQALHALQDFYAHSNYVELSPKVLPPIDKRIGGESGTFAAGGSPAVAGPMEETCLVGEYLFTDDLLARLQAQLIGEKDPDKRIQEQTVITELKAYLADPTRHRLTSGFFYFNPTGYFESIEKAGAEVVSAGKCRHGFDKTVTVGNVKSGAYQPGINKDTADRPYFAPARTLAVQHSTHFIVSIIEEVLSDTTMSLEDRVYCVLGLMGYENPQVIEGFRIGVPGAPNGASWDTAIGGLLRGNLKNIQPDISVCFESRKVPRSCGQICPDADWSNELNAYVCEGQPVADRPGILVTPDLRVLVREADVATVLGQSVGYTPNRVIASFRVEDVRTCEQTMGGFCTLQLDQDRGLWIQFKLGRVFKYTGPQRTDAFLPPANTVPEAKPAGLGSDAPPAPGPPPTAPATGPIASTSSPGTTSTGAIAFAAPTSPTAFATPASPTATPTNPTAAPTAAAARPAAAAMAPLRTADGIDQRLALRDLDNCVGADRFYPAPSATQTQTKQVYQMAAFSLAITDAATKQAVLNAIQARAGDDAFFSVMTDVIANPLQSQALTTAYQNTAKNIAQQISSNGLTSLMPSPVPPTALPSYVDRWLASKLSTPALVSTAVDMMAKSTSVTAECTINELAKEGFTDMVLAR